MNFDNILQLIGNTPLLKLKNAPIYAKIEFFNPLSSVKDRAAFFMIKGAEIKGELKPGGTIIEPTSGNTGIGLAYIGKQLGYKTILTIPENMSSERIKLLKMLGAQVFLTGKEKGMAGAVELAKELTSSIPNSYMPDQFSNPNNVLAHAMTTVKEIIKDLGEVIPTHLVLGIGTGGTIMGIAPTIKEKFKDIKIVAVEPEESPLLSKGKTGPHGIMGIGANFIPKILDPNIIDRIIPISTQKAKDTSIYAAQEFGTLIGISSGAALAGCLKIIKEDPNAIVVTLFPDTGERYLSVLT